ncbi:CHAT domain-containing protein [Sphingomonas parva]|nr:CHAT domain-containing protein [Sphingomonas parva]
MFGIAIGRDRTMIYRLPASLSTIENLAAAVQMSARSDDEGVLRPFDVAASERLFRSVAGPAAAMVAGATRLIYNPAGPLRQLPASIFVTDRGSVDAYAQQQFKADYSRVQFLGRKVETSTALSPRAFLRGRKELAPSTAPRPFLGLGENAPPQPASATTASRAMPFDCSVSYGLWADTLARRKPISADEIGIAANALGVADSRIVGPRFSDANLAHGDAADDLAQYQVLHFATHGIPEMPVNVDQCTMHLPPALITTLTAPPSDAPIVSDGLLSFDEVARLRLNANLVVLSACDTFAGASTALARRRGIEESTPALDGLVRSFIVANARMVLATFWRVPAHSKTDELLAAFYRAGRTDSVAASLKTAQNHLMDQPRYSHPYYWGAYFLVGDGSKAMLSPTRTAAAATEPGRQGSRVLADAAAAMGGASPARP